MKITLVKKLQASESSKNTHFTAGFHQLKQLINISCNLEPVSSYQVENYQSINLFRMTTRKTVTQQVQI